MSTQPNNTPEGLRTRLDYILKSHACTQVNFDKAAYDDYPKMFEAVILLLSQAIDQKIDSIVGELPKAIESKEIDVEATRAHMESKGATENDIMNMEIEADDRKDVLNDAKDAVTSLLQKHKEGKL
jgi:hypothetical protein